MTSIDGGPLKPGFELGVRIFMPSGFMKKFPPISGGIWPPLLKFMDAGEPRP